LERSDSAHINNQRHKSLKIRQWQIGPFAYVYDKRMVTVEKLKEIEAGWQPGGGFSWPWEGPFEVDEADLDPDRPGFTKELL